MHKVVIAPGTFKGSLTAAEAAEAMARGVRRAEPNAEIVAVPVGDGGEGTAAALSRAAGEFREEPVVVIGPLLAPAPASFVLLGPDYRTAALDMASASGLLLIDPADRNPLFATTYGVGELLSAALRCEGVRRVIVGLGGSATNDCGAGCLQALGFDLLDQAGIPLPAPLPPRHLDRVAAIDDTNVPKHIRDARITLACDVDNPLAGPRGATRVFGPQKGATAEMVELLEAQIARFGAVLDTYARGCGPIAAGYVPVPLRAGAGAAGGLGAGLMAAFPGASIERGIDVVLDVARFDDALRGADLVLTGEGKLDAQTLGGKAIHGVLRRARRAGVPVVAIAGAIEEGVAQMLKPEGLAAAVSLLSLAKSVDEAMARADYFVAQAAESAAGGAAHDA